VRRRRRARVAASKSYFLLSILDFNRTYNKVQQEVSEWPSEYDLLAATRALLRLRTTYNLDIDLVIRGVIYDEQTYLMTWPLMELIMEEAEESEMFDEALLWCDAVISSFQLTTLVVIGTDCQLPCDHDKED
jgi:hypothetical protein